jgi:hypothetical protein
MRDGKIRHFDGIESIMGWVVVFTPTIANH